MDAEYLAKKEKVYAAERARIELMSKASVTVKELLDSHKGIDEAKAKLEGKVIGFGGFRAFLAVFMEKHPDWFRDVKLQASGEDANERRRRVRPEEFTMEVVVDESPID